MGAVLHAAHHLLADKAALGKGHAVELIEIGIVWEGIAKGVVLAALGHPQRDAMRMVVLGLNLQSPARADEVGRQRRLGQGAQSERSEPRIGEYEAAGGSR